jgi:ADP-ribose pyrophosphatase YjhB (NUDIX family)
MNDSVYSPGRDLSEYPRPSVAVDVAAFTYSRQMSQLMLLLVDGENGLRLPGAFVREREPLAQTVERCMMSKAGMKGARGTLLGIFDEPDRDPRGWVLTAAHLMVVPETDAQRYDRSRAKWLPTHANLDLQGDHNAIVDAALEKLRSEYEIDQTLVKGRPSGRSTGSPRNIYAGKPDPEYFFSEPFTLRELQVLHEIVAGRVFLSGTSSTSSTSRSSGTLRDTFRRLMEPQLVEVGTNEGTFGSRGAPSRTWLHRN